MRITATVVSPFQVELDLPENTPSGEIRAKILKRARWLAFNNGLVYEVLECSIPDLTNPMALRAYGVPPDVEVVYVEAEEPDWDELAEFGVTRVRRAKRDPDD